MILDGIASGQVGIPDGDYILYHRARHFEAERRKDWSFQLRHIDDDGNRVFVMIPPHQAHQDDIPFVCF